MEAVATAGRPSRHHGYHRLGHEADQPLYFEDMESACARRIHGLGGFALGIAVAILASDALVTARAEGPTAIRSSRPVTGQEYGSDF